MIDFKFVHGLDEDAKFVRQKVFVEEQGFQDEEPEIDKRAWHFVVYYAGRPIGVARFYDEDPETWHIGRVAVLKEYRHQKVGRYIMKFVETKIEKELGGRWAILQAQIEKKDFYLRCGYHPINDGEIIYDQGHPHIMMAKFLKKNSKYKPRTKY